MPVDGTNGCMIADIGGGTTDVAIIALGGVVTSTSIRHAGDKMNEAIIQYMRKRHALLIGERTAEELKINIGCACLDEDKDGNEVIVSMDARGRDIISGLPKTLSVTNKDMMIALQESLDIIIDAKPQSRQHLLKLPRTSQNEACSFPAAAVKYTIWTN